MSEKKRGSQKLQLKCKNEGTRNLDIFENVEEVLAASGGYEIKRWWRYGQPAILDLYSKPTLTSPMVNPAMSADLMIGR